MSNCQMGTYVIGRKTRNGLSKALFTKDSIPQDKGSKKYKLMIDFLNEFNITSEEYQKYLENSSETSNISTNTTTSSSNNE